MKSNERKKIIRKAKNCLSDGVDLLSLVTDDLRCSLSFVPENLRSGAQYEKREANVDRLYIAMDQVLYAIDELADIIG